jgi:ribosomal-protein-alanine N-acetyltransferase
MSVARLEGPRIVLRELHHADAPGLHEAYGDAQAMRFWDMSPSGDVLQTASRIGRSLGMGAFWHGCWAIIRRHDERFMGMVNYHHREPWNRRLELGWILARPFQGQGFMNEAVTLVLRHCFASMDVHRVEACINPLNEASRALAIRLGFRQESDVMRDRLCVDGVFQDLILYALLAPEWRDPDQADSGTSRP